MAATQPASPKPAPTASPLPGDLQVSGSVDTGEVAPRLREDLAAYEAVEAAAGAGFIGRDAALLLRDGDNLRLYRLSRPGGRLKPLPPLPFRMASAACAAEDVGHRWIIGRDAGGDEDFRLHAYSPRHGQVTPWPMPPGRASEVVFAPGGERFLYAHTPAGTSRWEIRLGEWPRGAHSPATTGPAAAKAGASDLGDASLGDTIFYDRAVLADDGIWSPADLDAEGRNALVLRTVSSFETELYALRIGMSRDSAAAKARSLRRIAPPGIAGRITWAKWLSPRGRKAAQPPKLPQPSQLPQTPQLPEASTSTSALAFIADDTLGFARLYRYAAATSTGADSIQALSPACDCDVEAAWVLPGARLVVAMNQGAASALSLVETENGRITPVRGLPAGVLVHAQPDADGQHMLVVLSHFGTPGDLYRVDLEAVRRGRPAAALWLRAPGLDRLPKPRYAVGEPRRMQVTPPDPLPPPQKTVPLWLLTPSNSRGRANRPAPVLVRLHGGPEQQARPGYDPLDRYLAEQWGVALAYPDVRGSSGYGRAYLAADDLGRRPKVLRDLAAVLDSLAACPGLDADRMALMGRSYGGFLAQAGALAPGARLRAAVSAVGISDFASFLAGTKGYRADLRRMEYGDERDSLPRKVLDSLSPLARMEGLRIPLLLLHGRNDPRVPYDQSVRVFAKLSGRHHPALFLTSNDEGHGARLRASRLRQMQVTARFLLRHLDMPSSP